MQQHQRSRRLHYTRVDALESFPWLLCGSAAGIRDVTGQPVCTRRASDMSVQTRNLCHCDMHRPRPSPDGGWVCSCWKCSIGVPAVAQPDVVPLSMIVHNHICGIRISCPLHGTTMLHSFAAPIRFAVLLSGQSSYSVLKETGQIVPVSLGVHAFLI